MFGYLPAPVLYGYISTTVSKKPSMIKFWSRCALFVLMFETIIIAVNLYIARYYKMKRAAESKEFDEDNNGS